MKPSTVTTQQLRNEWKQLDKDVHRLQGESRRAFQQFYKTSAELRHARMLFDAVKKKLEQRKPYDAKKNVYRVAEIED